MLRNLLIANLLCWPTAPAFCQVSLPPYQVRIPSERPSGNSRVDQIWLTFYPSRTSNSPAVVVVHSLAEGRRSFLHRQLHRMAAYFAQRGIAAAVMELPYHMRRLPRGVSNLRLYTGSDARALNAYDQAAADISTVAEWLRKAPGVDSAKIGIVGLSLGAILTHLAMGRDVSLSAGVAILGGGDLDRLRRESLLARLLHPNPPPLTDEMRASLDRIDPLTFAHMNRPRRVLMIQASRDLFVPPSTATALREALGRPPIRWVDTNHFGLLFAGNDVARAAADYLFSVWAGETDNQAQIPSVRAATVKLGLLIGADFRPTPALLWESIKLGRRADHMSLFHLDIGLSGRGFFGGLGLTVNPSLDIGIGRFLGESGARPYASLHLVF